MSVDADVSILIPIIGKKDLVNQYRNEALIQPRLDDAIEEWHSTQPVAPQPKIIEHAVDPDLQTGESALLGGALEIKSPWKID